ncbi:MAG: phosphopantetheine-binding protein, partial [Bacteroidota bacterium]
DRNRDCQIKYVAPTNEIEELVAEVWQEVFSLEKIGINENFLELGGHSLTAIKIVSRLAEQLDLTIPVSIIFERPNIAEIAQYVEQRILTEMG